MKSALEDHLARLDRIRGEFLRLVAPLTAEEIASVHSFPDLGDDISPAWTLHHLMQHEAEHRGQIGAILALRQAWTTIGMAPTSQHASAANEETQLPIPGPV